MEILFEFKTTKYYDLCERKNGTSVYLGYDLITGPIKWTLRKN